MKLFVKSQRFIGIILLCLCTILISHNVSDILIEYEHSKLAEIAESIEESTTIVDTETTTRITPKQLKMNSYVLDAHYIAPEVTTKASDETSKDSSSNKSSTSKTSTHTVQYEEDEHGKYYWFNASCTAYCGCGKCCGKYAANRNWDENGEQIILTASGNRAVPKYTIAMSKNFKFGTKVYIEGIGMCEVMDRGGAVKGNVIDIYFGSHEDALNWGRRSIKVKIYL